MLINKAKYLLTSFLLSLELLRCFLLDFKQYAVHSFSFGSDSEDKNKAKMMLEIHALEKGLSFSLKKRQWGTERSRNLTRLIKNHITKYGKCEIITVAINVLNAYLKDEFSTTDMKLRNEINQLLRENVSEIIEDIGGIKSISSPNFKQSYDELLQFYSSRVSVRDYSMQEVTNKELQKAKELSLTTPSVCNRQPARIHIFKDKEIIEKILNNQLGDQGWAKNANVLIIITSNLSFYGGTNERQQALIDGGMFAMNFMMGLHAQKIASCFKMFIRQPSREKLLKTIANIPAQEIPIVLILAGHYPNNLTQSPISYRSNMQ